MSITVIWLNFLYAKVFNLSADEMLRETLQSPVMDPEQIPDGLALFKQIVATISDESKILILGSGNAKELFFEYLNTKHPTIVSRVVACESTDISTDQDIAYYSSKYFQKPVK